MMLQATGYRLQAWGWQLAACSLWLSCLTGCVRQTMTIRTEPPGALVAIDAPRDLRNEAVMDQAELTPVTIPFTWYRPYQMSIRKTGYQPIDETRVIKAPWYLWIPLDLIAELMPFPVKEHRELVYQLEPLPPASAPATEETAP